MKYRLSGSHLLLAALAVVSLPFASPINIVSKPNFYKITETDTHMS